jgi:hypothetical protein
VDRKKSHGLTRIFTDDRKRNKKSFDTQATWLSMRISTVSYDSLVARAIALAMRPVTRLAPVIWLRLAQQAWSRSLPSKVISSERAVPF